MDLPVILPLLTLPLLWVVLGQLFGYTYPVISRLVSQLSPQPRLLFQLSYPMLPLIIAATIAVMVFTPVIGGVNLSGHCHTLGCAAHVPVLHAEPVSAGILSGVLLLTGIVTLLILVTCVWRNHQMEGMLCKLSHKGIDQNFNVLETPEVIACCVGLMRPQVLISRGLLEQASPLQLQVIVSHELAHAYQFDNLGKLLVSLASLVWSETRRQQLLADIELAGEQRCDEYVSQLLGNRTLVADTICAFTRWHAAATQTNPPQSNSWEARVAMLSMLPVTDDVNGWKTVMTVFTGSAVLTLVASDVLHRAAESLLTVVPVIY